jgi:hypothetical protein
MWEEHGVSPYQRLVGKDQNIKSWKINSLSLIYKSSIDMKKINLGRNIKYWMFNNSIGIFKV